MHRQVLRRVGLTVALAVGAAPAAMATTVTSDTIANICNAVVTLYGSPAPGGQVVLYHGNLPQHAIALQVYPSQGTRVCYTRAVDPLHCTGAMTPQVCHPVTAEASDVFDIR